MICPTCKQQIPDSASGHPLLACPTCTARKSLQAQLNFERQFIRRLREGAQPVTLAKPAAWHRWHLILAPHHLQTWCGAPVARQWDRRRGAYPTIDQKVTPLCEDCVRVFDALEPLEEVHPEVA